MFRATDLIRMPSSLHSAILSTVFFGSFSVAFAQQPAYVGSQACSGCHAGIYRSFSKTDMGKSMQSADALKPGLVPAEATIPAPGGQSLRVYRDATGWHQMESVPGVFEDDHKLDYVVGSGANGLSFIVHRGSYLFQAPLSFYSKTGQWDLSPGYENVDVAFGRTIAQECVLCHSGRPEPVVDRVGKYADPPFRELAIGCENCHGPGSAHINRPKAPGVIVNPAKLAPRVAEEICTNCHQGGDAKVLQPGKTYRDFHPGQWLLDTVAIFKKAPFGQEKEADLLEHNAAMKLSRCFRESGGKLSCLTCHDPHVQIPPAESSAYFQQKCLTCHTQNSCTAPLAARERQSPPNDCLACHMPKRAIAKISHSALTNHRIPARPDEPLPLADAPTDDTGLILVNPSTPPRHLSGITLLQAYSQLVNNNALYQQKYLDLLARLSRDEAGDPYVQAALGHKKLAEGKNEEALISLTPALRLENATVESDVAQALTNLGRPQEALPHWEAAAQIDAYNPVILKTLTLQYIQLHKYAEAERQMRSYVENFPEDTFMRNLLARVQKEH